VPFLITVTLSASLLHTVSLSCSVHALVSRCAN
jgi:hypothetical protein